MYGCVYDSVCACVFWKRSCRIIFSEALDSSFLSFDLHLRVSGIYGMMGDGHRRSSRGQVGRTWLS